jgi:aldose 1-epimerase
MAITTSAFGEYGGTRVDQFHLTSESGAEVDIIGFGVTVRDWRVPVSGGLRSVVLGFDHIEGYDKVNAHFGAIAGRVANRIKDSSFTLDGVTYELPPNVPGRKLHLHGGAEGLGRLVWQGEPDSARNAVRFTHFSPDGAMGYPGNVHFEAFYQLRGNRLRLELTARTDRPTPVSLVQHQYFNLGLEDTVLDHTIQVDSSAYTELGPDLAPTGAILPSAGTIYDLRAPRTMRDANGRPVDYDIGLVLDQGRDVSHPVAAVTGPDQALTLRLWTDRPGLQVYNGVWTESSIPGLNGRHYGKNSGLCLEDQNFPDALHNPHFPNIVITPEQPYSHWCEIAIS